MSEMLMNLEAFFSPGGPLSRVLDAYEHRTQQVQMSRAVASALADRGNLVVEAGTGVGKSLAYMLPAYLRARENEEPVVVSTYTINLQEQLLEKDIPLLESALGHQIRAVVAKGRGNYVCLRRLGSLRRTQPVLFEEDSSGKQLRDILEWSLQTRDGSLSDLDFFPARSLWEQICSNRFACAGKSCSTYEACFFRQARQALRQAQIVVANHYLYFTDLSAIESAQQVLPPHSCTVFDEAHTLEDVACECLGLAVSLRAVTYLAERLTGDGRRSGILQTFDSGGLDAGVRAIESAARDFFDRVREWSEHDAPENRRICEPLQVTDTLSAPLVGLAHDLLQAGKSLDDEGLASELAAYGAQAAEYGQAVQTVTRMSLADYVYWVEADRRDTGLRAAPVRVSGILSRALFSRIPSVVLTGATLAVGKKEPFRFLRERLGLNEAQELQLGSPFDYRRQATLHIERGLPSPRSEDYIPAIVHAMKHYLGESHGRALVLFTSYEHMRAVSERLSPFLEEQGCRVLVQGSGMPRARLLETFRLETDSVLFGTSSFWQGVDVPGEALSCVIIARLPFAVPTTPVQEARLEEIEAGGQDPFTSYSLPQAVIKLKQGVGRLIRSKTDTGSIVILDSRIATRNYGKTFLESLPDCRIVENA